MCFNTLQLQIRLYYYNRGFATHAEINLIYLSDACFASFLNVYFIPLQYFKNTSEY